jgi:DNA-binding IclR family transcriptional regulator
MAEKLTDRARLYLNCVDDWKAPYEVAALINDTPPPTSVEVQRMLRRLASRGLVRHSIANNTYRISDEGRAALVGSPSHPEVKP